MLRIVSAPARIWLLHRVLVSLTDRKVGEVKTSPSAQHVLGGTRFCELISRIRRIVQYVPYVLSPTGNYPITTNPKFLGRMDGKINKPLKLGSTAQAIAVVIDRGWARHRSAAQWANQRRETHEGCFF